MSLLPHLLKSQAIKPHFPVVLRRDELRLESLQVFFRDPTGVAAQASDEDEDLVLQGELEIGRELLTPKLEVSGSRPPPEGSPEETACEALPPTLRTVEALAEDVGQFW